MLNNLKTPSFIVDLDILESNIDTYQQLATKYNKKLVLMTKTHKSTEIAKIQLKKGASGFVVGTIDEAIKLSTIGVKDITIPYPLLGTNVLETVNTLREKVNIVLSIDSYEVMKQYDLFFKNNGKILECLIIVNSGLNRFGVSPNETGKMASDLIKNYPNLKFKGISTHPGQVYNENNYEGVKRVAREANLAMEQAYKSLKRFNVNSGIIVTGSTPTYLEDVKIDRYNVLRPGNYVFFDRGQMTLGSATESNCALTVLATVISHPCENRFVIDCGSKCLGLDQGAHGSTSIIGYGKIIDHDELVLKSLSEEVGIIESTNKTKIKIGDHIRIIPNHSCSVANMTNYLIGIRKGRFERIIKIDMRGNSIMPNIH